MAEPKLLISDEDWAEIQRIALARKTRGQTLMRDAVLNWLHGDRPDLRATGPPADAAKLRRAAATARQLAEQLDTLLAGNAEPQQDTISMPVNALISMLMEVMKNGQNAPAAEAVQAAVDRIAREFGTADRTATADSGSAASTARGKRGSAR